MKDRIIPILLIVIALLPLSYFARPASGSPSAEKNEHGETQASAPDSGMEAKARLQGIVKGLLAAWEKSDVVCLGEDHGEKNDSDLRIALVEHPEFARKINVIMVEFANSARQNILDRFALDGENLSREELSVVWKDISGAEVWESPIYETFLRAVRKVNLALPRRQRVRLLGGMGYEKNRGKFIREAVSREILDKKLKGLAIYGARHCECRGMGFPGELADQYPGRIWAAFNFYDVEEGMRVFGLGAKPALIPISGTEKAKIPAARLFPTGRNNGAATLGDVTHAIVYYGNAK